MEGVSRVVIATPQCDHSDYYVGVTYIEALVTSLSANTEALVPYFPLGVNTQCDYLPYLAR